MNIALVGHFENPTAGYPIALRQIEKWGTRLGYNITRVEHGQKPSGFDAALHLVPFMFPPVLLPNCRNVIYTMNESSKYHEKALRYLPQYSKVIVPNLFNEHTLAADGIASTTAPLGIDREDWAPQAPSVASAKGYTVLCVAHQPRKGAATFAQAFHIAFKDDPDTLGILKSKTYTKSPRIQLINANSSFEDHKRLIRQSDLCVLPSLGEGFSFLPLEFLSQGKPVIVSNNSAHKDFSDNLFIKLEKQRAFPAELYGKFYRGDFWESDPHELALWMLWTKQKHVCGELQGDLLRAQRLMFESYDAEKTTKRILELTTND